jgi:hypothetical protein
MPRPDRQRPDRRRPEEAWLVELDGQAVARLVEPAWDPVGQFWYRYRVAPAAEGGALPPELADQAFWDDNVHRLDYRHAVTGAVAAQAVHGQVGRDADGRVTVTMRGLPHAVMRRRRFWSYLARLGGR